MPDPSEPPRGTLAPGAPWTSRQLLDWIKGHLEAKDVDAPRVCAELLIAHVLGCDRLHLYMEPDRLATTEERELLRALVGRAARHEPVQLLVGIWPFYGRELEVAPCTLIPRPSTEALVDRALQEINTRGPRQSWRILDLCTGSGCIAVSLAASVQALRAGRVSSRMPADLTEETESEVEGSSELPVLDLDLQPLAEVDPEEISETTEVQSDDTLGELTFIATDIVEEALALAERNAALIGVNELVELRVGSLFDPLLASEHGMFDIICANPPYVSDEEYEKLDRNVREYEPAVALRAGEQGLDLVEPIIRESPKWLRSGGLLLVEIGDSMHEPVRGLAQETVGLRDIEILPDHEGYNRVLLARAE